MRKLVFFFISFFLLSLSLSAAIYYVDSAVTDTNPASATPDFTTYNHLTFQTTGGTDSVYKTIADLNVCSFAADDFIYFRKGQTWKAEFDIPTSGTSGHPITYGAFGSGAAPLIDATESVLGVAGDWTDGGGNVWNRALATECQHVIFDSTHGGVEDATPDTQYEWDWVTPKLYVYSIGNPTGYYTSIEAAQRDCGVYTSARNYITIDGIDFRGGNLSCVYFFGGAYTTVNNSTITFGALDGVRWASTATYGTATYCTISYVDSCGINCLSTATTGFTITDNTIHHYGQDPAKQYAQGITGGASSSIIARNTVHDQPAATTNGYGHGIYWTRGTSVEIYLNEVYGILNGNGIKIKADGGSTSAKVYRNYSYNCRSAGIAVERAYNVDTLTVEIYYNILVGSHYGILLMNTYVQTFNAYIYNNVCYKNIDTSIDIYPTEMRIMNNPSVLVVENNIFFGLAGTTYKEIESVALTAATIDNNCYKLGTFYYSGASRTWAYWQGTLGFDANGLNADPLFVNAGGSYASAKDFCLEGISPCRDAGVDVSLTEDYEGNAITGTPDIGAFEITGNWYFDATSGSDTANSGYSTTYPLKTIAVLNGLTFDPGDNIYFKRGETWREQLTVPSSGSAGLPITIGAYGTGAGPIIDGGSTRPYCITTNGKDYIIIENLQLRGATAANVLLNGANQSELNYCLILNGGVDGVEMDTAASKVQNCVIYGNVNGIDVDAEGSIKNTIIRNSTNDLALTWVVSGNCVVIDQATIQKVGGSLTWDSQGYSAEGYVQSCAISFKAGQTNLAVAMGLNSDPATDATLSSLDYCWCPDGNGNAYILESDSLIGNYGAYTTSTVFLITYDGTNIKYYMDDVLKRTVARAAGAALYIDSSFYHAGGIVNSILFTTLTNKTTNSIEDDGAADPLFVSAGSDFTLQPTSPCIDKGVYVSLTTDYYGNTIPEGITDIGAHEIRLKRRTIIVAF